MTLIRVCIRVTNEDNPVAEKAGEFESRELTVEQIAGYLQVGSAVGGAFNGSRDCKQGLVTVELVPITIDDPPADLLDHALVKAGGCIAYAEQGRSSAVVVLRPAEPLVEPDDIHCFMYAAAFRLGGDLQQLDSNRLLVAGAGAKVWCDPDQRLSPELQQDLIRQGRHLLSARGRGLGPDGFEQACRLTIDQEVVLADGRSRAPLARLPVMTPVCCPVHADRDGSAYVAKSETGVPLVTCTACQMTFWPIETDASPSFDNAVLRLHRAHSAKKAGQNALDDLFGADGAPNVTICTDGVRLDTFGKGLIFIKGPKGVGKTELLCKVFSQVDSALYAVHRRTLTQQAAERLRIACYLDEEFDAPKLTLCFDSVLKLPHEQRYKVVVIDECEQVLAHILSRTLDGPKRPALFNEFVRRLQQAETVIALDADLGWASFLTLTRLANLPDPKQGTLFDGGNSPVRLIMNTSKPGVGKTIEMYGSRHHLEADLHKAISEGKRVFAASNSRRQAERLTTSIRTAMPQKRVLLVTKHTKKDEAQRRFLRQPAAECPNYDVIITSPAAGTGLDISFPHQEKRIDIVFGFCCDNSGTHLDFDQQISRVRHPGEIKIWVTPKKNRFDTRPESVNRKARETTLREYLRPARNVGQVVPNSDPLVDMAVMLTIDRNRSKNDLLGNFLNQKKDQGFNVEWVSRNEALVESGKVLNRIAKAMGDEAYANRLIAAPCVGSEQFENLERADNAGAELTETERFKLERAKIEGFYRQPITPALIELDDHSYHRGRVRLFEDVSRNFGRPTAPFNARDEAIADHATKVKLVRQLTRATPVVIDGFWNSQVEFTKEQLSEFCRCVTANRRVLETQLDLQARENLDEFAMKQLGHVLQRIGLELDLSRDRKVAGKKVRFYRLKNDVFLQMQQIARRRAKVSAHDYLDEAFEQRNPGEVIDEDEFDDSDEENADAE